MEPWRAVDTHNGGVEAQNGALKDLCTPVVANFDEDSDPNQSVKGWIRIRIKVKKAGSKSAFK